MSDPVEILEPRDKDPVVAGTTEKRRIPIKNISEHKISELNIDNFSSESEIIEEPEVLEAGETKDVVLEIQASQTKIEPVESKIKVTGSYVVGRT